MLAGQCLSNNVRKVEVKCNDISSQAQRESQTCLKLPSKTREGLIDISTTYTKPIHHLLHHVSLHNLPPSPCAPPSFHYSRPTDHDHSPHTLHSDDEFPPRTIAMASTTPYVCAFLINSVSRSNTWHESAKFGQEIV